MYAIPTVMKNIDIPVFTRRCYKNSVHSKANTNEDILSLFGFDCLSQVDTNLRSEIIAFMISKNCKICKNYLGQIPEDMILIVSKYLTPFDIIDVMASSKSIYKLFSGILKKLDKVIIGYQPEYCVRYGHKLNITPDYIGTSGALLKKMNGVKELYIYNRYSSVRLKKLTSIDSLIVDHSYNQETTIASIQNLKHLKILNTKITIEILLKKESLETLHLSNCKIAERDYLLLCVLPNLTHICIDDKNISDVAKEKIEKMFGSIDINTDVKN